MDEILSRLDGVKKEGSRWWALCPCHDDHNPSLCVRLGTSGRVLIGCKSCGATYGQVLARIMDRQQTFVDPQRATGEKRTEPLIGLTLEQYSEGKKLPIERLKEYGLATARSGSVRVVDIPYRDQSGNVVAVRRRAANKKLWRKGDQTRLYGLDRLGEGRERGYAFLVEGESDCHTLWSHGEPAVGIPGATTFKPEWVDDLDGVETLYFWYEHDSGGGQLLGRLPLDKLVNRVRVVWTPGFKDASEAHVADPDGFPAKLETARRRAIPLADLRHLADRDKGLANTAREFLARSSLTLDQLLALERVEQPSLVEGFLPMGGINMVVAKPKVGKSTFLRTLVKCVAKGEPFLGREVQQGGVFFLAMEEKDGELQGAFEAMGVPTGLPMQLVTRPPGMNLDEATTLVEEAILQFFPVLIVIDPLFRLVRAKDANDYAEMTRCLEPFLVLARRYGVCIVLAHHGRKGHQAEGGDSILGSTAILGSADNAIEIAKRKGNARVVSTIQRYGEDLPATELVLDPDTGTVSLGSPARDEEDEDVAERVLAFLEGNPGANTDSVLGGVKGRAKSIKGALAALAESGQVSVEGAGKRGSPRCYTLA